MSDAGLRAHLDAPLPAALPAGRPTALFLLGTAWAPDLRVRGLHVEVDGIAQPVDAWGLPRPDVGGAADPEGPEVARRAGASGFWATVEVPAPRALGEVRVDVVARLEDGAVRRAPLARLPVGGALVPGAPFGPPAGPQRICVCMATYEPDPALFALQVGSLREQRDADWICVISDDASSPAALAQIREVLGDDPRFALSPSGERLGFYRNFERALALVPADTAFVALCDQDDRWHPDKLRVLRDALGDARLVFSDQRLTDAAGAELRGTLWEGRANNHTDLTSMLVANTVTGAASLFPRALLDVLLPFPETPGIQFHDHWLSVVALATGDVAYVPRALYDYVQHDGAVFGDVSGGRRERVAARDRRPGDLVLGPLRQLVARWRAAYFHGYEVRRVLARTALARGGALVGPQQRRALERYDAAARSPVALARLALRPLRALAGHTETLGAEREIAQGVLWRWAIGLLARVSRVVRRPLGDARVPFAGDFEQRRLRAWRAQTRTAVGRPPTAG